MSGTEKTVRVFTPSEVSAMQPAVVTTLIAEEVVALGPNIALMSTHALASLSSIVTLNKAGQIQSITPDQIALLSTDQVRSLGTSTSQSAQLSALRPDTWATLVSNINQVRAITPAEIPALPDEKIVALGSNIANLSDKAISALSNLKNSSHPSGQIQSLTPVQIQALSVAQIQLLGTLTPTGVSSIADVSSLNTASWLAFTSDPAKVASILPAQVPQILDPQISAMGPNIAFLTDSALSQITSVGNSIHNIGQIQSLTAAQVSSFTPHQFSILCSDRFNTGLSFLSNTAITSVSASQLAALLPVHFASLTAKDFALFTPASLKGLSPSVVLSLTPSQKSLLNADQHLACGC